MANEYDYDEGGLMAAYFLLTFVSIALIPLSTSYIPAWSQSSPFCQCSKTYSSPHTEKPIVDRCPCPECEAKERDSKPSSSLTKPTLKSVNPLSRLRQLTNTYCRGSITLALWATLFAIIYKITTTRVESSVYDPFEILGLKAVRICIPSLCQPRLTASATSDA